MDKQATNTLLTEVAASAAFDPFAGPEILRLVPITEPQAEIWAACLLGGDNANRAYNESITLRLSGPLNHLLLQRALQAVVRRHEALRSAFSADGRYSYVVRELTIPLHYQDISHEGAATRVQLADAYVKQDAQHLFNLLSGPLLKAGLLCLAPEEHHFVLTAHHIICDGWSMGIVLQDLSKFYSAYTQNQPPNLPPTVSFSRYADQQLVFKRSPAHQQVEQFWLQQFQGDVPILTLPTDFPRPPQRTYKSTRADYQLSPEVVADLKKVGISAGCSLVTTLLSAVEIFLHQLTGQEDIVVGLPAAGQSAAGRQRLVGHCVNLLPLRSKPGQATNFLSYLRQRKSALFDVYEHQQLTFGSLLQKLRIPRDTSRIPLIPVMFNIDLGLADGIEFHGLHYQLLNNPRAYETFELFINASGTEQALVLEWSYNTALFTPATIARLMANLELLLRELSRNPTGNLTMQPTVDPVVLPDAYRTLNATAQPYPADKTLHQLLAEQARATPHSTAVKFGSSILSYQELHSKANQLANYLLAQGVRSGDTLALAVERSSELVITLLASMKCGATYVPLDPAYPKERLEYMLADSGAKFLLTSALAGITTDASVHLIADALKSATIYSEQEPPVDINPTQALYILYTSGSTGKPKGVQISHRNVVNFLCSMRQTPGISADDRLLAITTISFDIAGLELFLPLANGATIVLADALTTKDGRLLLRALEEEQITIMQATPSSWRMLLDAGWRNTLPLKVLCGGEALSTELAERLLTKSQSIWNLYGPTETTIWSAVKQVTSTETTISIGRPIANTQFYILDEHGKLVAPGAVGELCIAGDGVALGYWQRPELTAEKFIANRFATTPATPLYRTGDLGKLLDSGELQCLGRLDQQVKIRGHRIEPGEIEQVLAELTGIQQAVVLTHAPQPGNEHLVAFVVPALNLAAPEIQPTLHRWKTELAQHLPAYMVPSQIVLVSTLPLTLNGKLDRTALLSQLLPANPVPSQVMSPRTNNEKLVAAIWQDCLGIDSVGVSDNFFELGGHSLLAVQVMARLEKETGQRLPLATLLEHPTVGQLAGILQQRSDTITWNSLVPIKPGGNKVPLYIVHGAGLNVLIFNALSKNMDTDQPVYGLQAKGLDGKEEPLETIEAMAAHYISAIMHANPTGPYALAGYSFGGIIAYEMVKQLLAAGKEVKFLGLFDTYANQSDWYDPWLHKLWKRSRFLVKKLAFDLVLLKNSPKTVGMAKVKSLQRLTLERLKYGKQQQYELKYGHPYKLGITQELAHRHYRLVPQPVAVHLFRNKEKTFYMEDGEFLGWKPFAQSGVIVYDIPGNHNFIFAPPNDKEAAAILQQALDSSLP